ASLLASIKSMDTAWPAEKWAGRNRREWEFGRLLRDLIKPLRIAMTAQAGQSRLLGVRLYVYGFSRGAATARTFVNWLNLLLEDVDSQPALSIDDLLLPVQIQYLGLLDTVASVGAADSFPGADGHMSWADDTQELPRSKLVKRCLHIVAGHEQRLSFPLDSIRREDGSYPENCVEVVHPGVHSDQGGGYPPGD
ncbi:T6SS phospholipase effector Tle1-like catalytic domain-containing protein, partial [Pseudomonas huaxiensis]|uniref:T6SS phospholipase effector Tle1-like catalytic domain-containing protein n=1 Tax=Pseudomonas huaxiensis TaxID=2213017 RepID=UPI0015AB065B